jgi:hypothetical protein
MILKARGFLKVFSLTSSIHELQKANGVLEYEIMIYMTSSSSVKKCWQFTSMRPQALSFSFLPGDADKILLIILCNHCKKTDSFQLLSFLPLT